MPSTVAQHTAIHPAVRAFLVGHDAEADFIRVWELARSCFPALRTLDVTLQADTEEEGRAQVLLNVTLPPTVRNEDLQLALKHYHSRLVEEIPLSHCPLFALVAEFDAE
jgi:hypothetical protein